MTLQEAIDRCGFPNRKVVSTISADFVHLWNNDEMGFSLCMDRRGNAQLELNTKHGDEYFTYRCDLSQVGQGDVKDSVEALRCGVCRETRGESIIIGNSENVLVLKAAG